MGDVFCGGIGVLGVVGSFDGGGGVGCGVCVGVGVVGCCGGGRLGKSVWFRVRLGELGTGVGCDGGVEWCCGGDLGVGTAGGLLFLKASQSWAGVAVEGGGGVTLDVGWVSCWELVGMGG